MTVVIGIDPHKASHTATAIGPGCVEAATIRLRAARSTPEELLIWAAQWPERRWGVEGAPRPPDRSVRASRPRRADRSQ